MIYTISLNPSIDYIMRIDDFNHGKTLRSTSESKITGGKGIMVSKLLKKLGQDSINLGFLGGFTGEFISDSLKSMDIKEDFIRIADDTRINVKLKYGDETEINAGGPEISAEESQKFLQQVKELPEDSILIMSGSAPRNLGAGYYKEIISHTKSDFTIDISGKEVLQYLEYRPILIKPNIDELAEIFAREIDVDNVWIYAKKLNELGARNVIVSMGGDGSIFVDENQALRAYPIEGKLVNSVGAGDSMVGGFIHGLSSGMTKEEAYKLAIACGTATAFSEDIGSREKIEEILKLVKVEKYGN